MIRRRLEEESGIAMLLALALITLITVISVTLLVVTSGDASRSRRDVKNTSSYQAAEAGTNAYLSDLTESTVFFNSYMAKGEATRTDTGGVAHASSNSSDVAWSSGRGRMRRSPRTTPAGSTSGNGYQYLIQVSPPNSTVQGRRR